MSYINDVIEDDPRVGLARLLWIVSLVVDMLAVSFATAFALVSTLRVNPDSAVFKDLILKVVLAMTQIFLLEGAVCVFTIALCFFWVVEHSKVLLALILALIFASVMTGIIYYFRILRTSCGT
jgi:hypothetical protein